MTIKITGIIQCKNEWPLVALTITHALINHVDEVYVLNDSSSDETYNGLMCLKHYHGNKITIINMSGSEFKQYFETNIVIELARRSKPDWFYVFDSDEFLIARDGVGLKEVLGKIDVDNCAVKYNVINFLSNSAFDDGCIFEYKDICYEAIANKKRNISHGDLIDKIYNEQLSFFDIPFQSKVVIRNDTKVLLKTGAHEIIQFHLPEKNVLICEDIYAVHIPYLTFARLNNKVEQGYKHILAGRPNTLGWQNQLLYKIHKNGGLQRYWERHSISSSFDNNSNIAVSVRINNDYADAIKKTIVFFMETGFEPTDLRKYNGKKIAKAFAHDTKFSMRDLIGLSEQLHELIKLSRRKGKKERSSIFDRLSKKLKKVAASLSKYSKQIN